MSGALEDACEMCRWFGHTIEPRLRSGYRTMSHWSMKTLRLSFWAKCDVLEIPRNVCVQEFRVCMCASEVGDRIWFGLEPLGSGCV